MRSENFTLVKEDPDDIIGALKTLSLNNISNCNWLEEEWETSENYLEWAKRGLRENDNNGFDVAITYSKKCVCRRIDSLILYNHLYPLKNKNYPEKIVTLELIGIASLKIVQKFIIDIRNELEHQYRLPTKEKAEDAINLAELAIDATQSEFERGSIVIVKSSFLYNLHCKGDSREFNFNGFSNHPMFIVDIFDKKIKIVDPQDLTIKYSPEEDFTKDQAIEMSKVLREHYLLGNKGSNGFAKGDLRTLLNKLKL